MARKIILDCDPGHDDAVALLLAHGDPRVELLAVTTVAGNHTLENTTRNARAVMTAAGITSHERHTDERATTTYKGAVATNLVLNAACNEMWNAASIAFGLCPLLTAGGIEALAQHGSADLKTRYLDKLVSGEWTATMNLTEPQAGSDLALLRSRAEPLGDGRYGIVGAKINVARTLLLNANVLFPLSDGGLKPKPTLVLGLDYVF